MHRNSWRFVHNNGCLDTGLLRTSKVLGVRNLYGLLVRVANPVLCISMNVLNKPLSHRQCQSGLDLVWLVRPSHLIAGALRAGRDGLAAVTISSHLVSTNQMLLPGNPANSIHSLWELSHAYCAFNGNGFLSGWKWSHQTQRGLQWARETTRSLRA